MTMLVETAVERYRFVCGRCGQTRTADYDVQYVSDDVGATFAFYRLDGVPVLPPPVTRSSVPPAAPWESAPSPKDAATVRPARLDSDQPRRRVTTSPEQRRASAPHLSAVGVP
ncbi:hypothetical protein [Actinomadura sp. DC4]|uniref:hypothetical protein n=1 Tax=Actinomadura sp. DC4 TaxID=3055069 RepID=UPI0025B1001C|nr:hypothetical protein [Actinomadura sp. DC4]MDN3358125.1 hypothetical protein [Actinomadura sp. DC4]